MKSPEKKSKEYKLKRVFFIEKNIAKTLIEEDIKNDDLGKARDRLHGLISTFPNELELLKCWETFILN